VQKVQSLETALKQCGEFVCALETEASSWQVITDANLAIDQLEREYFQTKVAGFIIPLLLRVKQFYLRFHPVLGVPFVLFW